MTADTNPHRTGRAKGKPGPDGRGHLVVNGLRLMTRGSDLVRDLSFETEAGSTTFVVGTSTRARSALLAVLLGVERASAGTAILDGEAIEDSPLSRARAEVAIVLHDPCITAGSFIDNIAFGLTDISRVRLEQAADLTGVSDIAIGFQKGLDTVVSEGGRELSLGQRRLIALARAVVRSPSLLLIEDPTLGLYVAERAFVSSAIRRLRGTTTVVVVGQNSFGARDNDQIIRYDRRRHSQTTPGPRRIPTTATGFTTTPKGPTGVTDSKSTGAGTGTTDTDDEDTAPLPTLGRGGGRPLALKAIGVGEDLVPGYAAASLVGHTARIETWLAWDRKCDHLVKLKIPRRSPATDGARDELTREYMTAVLLRHPGLARPLTASLDTHSPYAVFEHVDGPTLSSALSSPVRGPDTSMVLRSGYELARTLCFVHQKGFAHLDLQPSNTVLSSVGTIVTDLRMALPIGAPRTATYRPEQVGTVAPEQLRGEPASSAMDIFALGIVMYQAATGLLSTSYTGPVGTRSRGAHPTATMPRSTGEGRGRATFPRPASDIPRKRRSGMWTMADDPSTTLSNIIARFTATEPSQRPTAEQAVALLRPYLFPSSDTASWVSPT